MPVPMNLDPNSAWYPPQMADANAQSQPPLPQAQPLMNMQAQAKKSPIAMPIVQKAQAPAKRTSSTTYDTASPEDIQSAADVYRNLPEVQAQKAALDKLQGMAEQNGSQQSAGWLQPIAALSDSLTGSKLAPTAQGMTQTAQQQNDKMLANLNTIDQRRQDLSKDVLNGINSTLKNKQGQTNIMVGDPSMGGMGGLASSRLEALRIGAGKQYDTDKILQGVQQTQNAFQKAQGFINGTVPLAKQDFDLVQKDVIDGTTKSGTSTVSQSDKEMFNTFFDALNKLKSKGGTIDDLKLAEPDLINHVQQKMFQIQKENADIADQRRAEIDANYSGSQFPGIAQTSAAKSALIGTKTAAWRDQSNAGLAPTTTVTNSKTGESHTLKNASAQDLADAAKDGFLPVKK